MRETDADELPLDPAAALALVEDQKKTMTSRLANFVPVILLVWGIAWLFGFGAMWLIDGAKPTFSLPAPFAITVFVSLLVVAMTLSVVLAIRSSRGMRGNSSDAFAGAVYGCGWWIGGLGIMGLGGGLAANGMSRELAGVYYPVASVIFAGIMYVVAAAIWRAVPMLVLGIWTILVAVVAPFFGAPHHYLVLALGGGLGFLAMAATSFAYLAKMRARVNGGSRRGRA